MINGKIVTQTTWKSKKYRNNVTQKTSILIDDNGSVNQFGGDANDMYLQLPGKQDDWMLFNEFISSLYGMTFIIKINCHIQSTYFLQMI